jgi:hypothetical protein
MSPSARRIPKEWLDGLAKDDMIEKAMQGLLGGKV